MQFGVQFFPDVTPQQKSAEAYFQEALDLAEEADRLGYSHIRIVEHYFHYYGGYSPNPIVFLPPAAQRARRGRPGDGAGVAGVQPPPETGRGDAAVRPVLRRRRCVGVAAGG